MNNQEQALQLRHNYMSCVKLANETDSKKEDTHLRQEAKEILEQLRQICQHQDIVLLRSEYEGSYSMDYDDRYKAHKICLCCGTEEYAHNNKWQKLTAKAIARFEYSSYHLKELPNQVREPLNYLLSEVKEVAEVKGYRV